MMQVAASLFTRILLQYVQSWSVTHLLQTDVLQTDAGGFPGPCTDTRLYQTMLKSQGNSLQFGENNKICFDTQKAKAPVNVFQSEKKDKSTAPWKHTVRSEETGEIYKCWWYRKCLVHTLINEQNFPLHPKGEAVMFFRHLYSKFIEFRSLKSLRDVWILRI